MPKREDKNYLVFDNFQTSTFFKREVFPQAKSYHRLIVSPTYLFKFVNGSFIVDMLDSVYPLISPFRIDEIPLTANDGKPSYLLQPTNTDDERFFYVTTTKGFVRAMKLTGVARDLGQPLNITNEAIGRQTTLFIFADRIFFVNPNSTSIFHIPEKTTGTSWTSISGFHSPYLGEVFSTFFYIADKNAAADPNRRIVRVFNASFSQVGTLDLGQYWDIREIINNNNRFLIIVAQPTNIVANQHLFFWNGSHQVRYFHAMKLPGIYLGGVNYMGSFVIFVKSGSGINVFEIEGYGLRLIDSIPSITVTEQLLPKQIFTVYGNYIVFPGLINDLNLNGLFVYNLLERETFFLPTLTNLANGVLLTNDLSNNIRLVFSDNTDDKVKNIFFIPSSSLDSYLQNTANPFLNANNQLIYVSQPINFVNEVQIDNALVFYGNKPVSTNQIFFDFEMKRKRTGEVFNETKSINVDGQKDFMELRNIGVRGDELTFKIRANLNGAYNINIKRVIINYTNLI